MLGACTFSKKVVSQCTECAFLGKVIRILFDACSVEKLDTVLIPHTY